MPFGPKNVSHVKGVDLGDLTPIPEFDGYYITRSGRVFSLRELSTQKDKNGYKRVSSGRIRKAIHQLMATVFLPPPQPGQNEVRHLDGNNQNNSIKNLAWGTRQDNAQDMARHGTVRGEGNPRAILTEAEVIYIRTHRRLGNKKLAETFGVSIGTIKAILEGRNWKHVKHNEAKPCE